MSAWDPFARDEPNTQSLTPQTLVIADEDGELALDVRPFVLPSICVLDPRGAPPRSGP